MNPSNGKPHFLVRAGGELTSINGPKRIVGGWHHIVGVMDSDGAMRLYVDGQRVADGKSPSVLTKNPAQGLEVGIDAGSPVGTYESPNQFIGIIDEVRLYFTAVGDAAVLDRFRNNEEMSGEPALVVTFDDGTARDMSTYRTNGTLENVKEAEGKFGRGIQLTGTGAGRRRGANNNAQKPGDSLVKPKWTADVPIYVRAMVLAGSNLFIVGPPDIIDEESTFQQLSERDPEVQTLLKQQDDALEGVAGGKLLAVRTDTGEVEHELQLDTLPAWDGLSGAQGQLFLTTLDGRVMCFGKSD
ncbi:MAG: LamG-like jellyroll fold domain-containing protein [Planctomycetaceae bacterium]